MIRNPILPGFNPDPSIIRVGDWYYIATSTFEWFPGVQLHRSRDLVNWELACRPLSRASQLDMRGNPDSGGIWAPCLSHADGVFLRVLYAGLQTSTQVASVISARRSGVILSAALIAPAAGIMMSNAFKLTSQ